MEEEVVVVDQKRIEQLCFVSVNLYEEIMQTRDFGLRTKIGGKLLMNSIELAQLLIALMQNRLTLQNTNLDKTLDKLHQKNTNNLLGRICKTILETFKPIISTNDTKFINILIDAIDIYVRAILLPLKDSDEELEYIRNELDWIEYRLKKLIEGNATNDGGFVGVINMNDIVMVDRTCNNLNTDFRIMVEMALKQDDIVADIFGEVSEKLLLENSLELLRLSLLSIRGRLDTTFIKLQNTQDVKEYKKNGLFGRACYIINKLTKLVAITKNTERKKELTKLLLSALNVFIEIVIIVVTKKRENIDRNINELMRIDEEFKRLVRERKS